MKPDAFMPFYGNDFFQALKGRKAFVKLAYLELIWFYWSHENCQGLEDDADFLRGVSGLSEDEWEIARPILFDNNKFFVQDAEGRWQQGRAQSEWEKAKASYDRAVKGGKNRWKHHIKNNLAHS